MALLSPSDERCFLTSISSVIFLSLLICFVTLCDIQVSVSKARSIIVLAEDGNADQVWLSDDVFHV